MKLRIIIVIAAFLLLTAVTQIGGAILILAMVLRRIALPAVSKPTFATSIVFIGLYLVVSLWVVPPLAAGFGRLQLPCLASASHPVAANSSLYCLANRNYVRPELAVILDHIGQRTASRYPGTIVSYLDAGFPFADGFPLLPHLSHQDGRKLDLALFYIDRESGRPEPRGGAWWLGYWAYLPARDDGEIACSERQSGRLRWDMDWLQPLFSDLVLDVPRTRAMVLAAMNEPIDKAFLEPYLINRFGMADPKLLFAGCHAARHDDHLHIQIR